MKLNNMKILSFYLAVLCLCTSTLSFGQKVYRTKHHEKIHSYKIAYITDKLSLSTQEAEKFWPIYNAYSLEMLALHKEERYKIKKQILKKGGIEKLSEEEAKKVILRIRDISNKKAKIKNDFFEKVATIIPYKKILALEVAEHEFNRSLIRKLRSTRKLDR